MYDVTRFDPHHYRYPSHRNVVYGSRGMVAASHPLAAQAGLAVLKEGGNAVDAAIAAAAALTVVEPTGNGLGSDAFALIWNGGKLHGINGSGYAPRACTPEAYQARGWKQVPAYGWGAVTVPGAVGTWRELSKKMGALPLKNALAPAIDYAKNGHAVSVTMAYNWNAAAKKYPLMKEPETREWAAVFTPNGRSPKAGELFTAKDHAHTLTKIAETDARAFYEGEIAEKMAAFARETDGFLTMEDLAEFEPEWVEPIGVGYRGYDVWEIPPNGQGICALIALNVLKGFDLRERDSADTFHKQIEAVKLGFADAHRYVADQRFSAVPVRELLEDKYAAARGRLILRDRATDFKAGDPLSGGTVYLSTADGEGRMVSYIQSNYMGFGSGVVCPGTGIAFNNRGSCFTMDPEHPNVLAGRKRPYNTIIPSFLTKDGQPVGPFGVMGGFMQPQGHLQVVSNVVDFGMNPQEALDAPRWQWSGGMKVTVEPGFPAAAALKLASRGHEIVPEVTSNSFGRGEIIWRTPDGTLAGAAEPRTDGCVAAW
ncbi:MAG: gamma-glutamyltransferase [Synergistaceae bacterium]|jgi:gamma-glutamyltranspeptidase/glutathione hydrolase|nr:gamma-glutamyltransferase [Synergistaceae bacterium]